MFLLSDAQHPYCDQHEYLFSNVLNILRLADYVVGKEANAKNYACGPFNFMIVFFLKAVSKKVDR